MTDVFVAVLVALAAISLGLRTTGLLIPRVHPLARFIVSAIVGWLLITAMMQICDSYQVHDLGLGLLVSLSPVGLYDLTKWWLRWRAGRPA
jgi:hypothetical protein